MFYDTLLCIALWFVTALLYFLLLNLVYGTERMTQMADAGMLDSDPVLGSILFLVTFGFFAYFWRRLGQTLGMQVWRVRVESEDGLPLRWTQCLLRFFGAFVSALPAGLGYWWMLWDKEGLTWHDRYSHSRVRLTPSRKKASASK